MQELTDVLWFFIIERMKLYEIKEISQLSKDLNTLTSSILWKKITKKVPNYIIEKYGGLVRTIIENSFLELNYDYTFISKYCKNLNLIRLEDDHMPYFDQMQREIFKPCNCNSNKQKAYKEDEKKHICFVDTHFLNLAQNNSEVKIHSFYIPEISQLKDLDFIENINFKNMCFFGSDNSDVSDIDRIKGLMGVSLYAPFPVAYQYISRLDCTKRIKKLVFVKYTSAGVLVENIDLFDLTKFRSLERLEFNCCDILHYSAMFNNNIQLIRLRILSLEFVDAFIITKVYNNCINLESLTYLSDYTHPDILLLTSNPKRLKRLEFMKYTESPINDDIYTSLIRIDLGQDLHLDPNQFPNIRIISFSLTVFALYCVPRYPSVSVDIINLYVDHAYIKHLSLLEFGKLVEFYPKLVNLSIFVHHENIPKEFLIFNQTFNRLKLTFSQDFSLIDHLNENISFVIDFCDEHGTIQYDIVKYFEGSLSYTNINFYLLN